MQLPRRIFLSVLCALTVGAACASIHAAEESVPAAKATPDRARLARSFLMIRNTAAFFAVRQIKTLVIPER